MFRTKFVLGVLATLLACLGYSQNIALKNLQATREGQITFDYAITKGHSDRERYDVKIFTSADNYAEPLNIRISEVPPEQGQKVTFRGADHFPSGYSGSVRIRLVAEATLYPVQILDYSKKVKAGAQMNISWQDAQNNSSFDVVLIQDGQPSTIANRVTGTSYSGTLPENFGKGSYQLKVVPDRDENSSSDVMPLAVVGKLGLGIKVLGALAAGGVGILALSGSDPKVSEDNSLPGPPSPPDN